MLSILLQCDRTMALDSFFTQVGTDPVKVALLGSGCSVATEPTAEISYYFNLVQVSFPSHLVCSNSPLAAETKLKYGA